MNHTNKMTRSHWSWANSSRRTASSARSQSCCSCCSSLCSCGGQHPPGSARQRGSHSYSRYHYVVLLMIVLILSVFSYVARVDLVLKEVVIRWSAHEKGSSVSSNNVNTKTDTDTHADTSTSPQPTKSKQSSLWWNIFTSSPLTTSPQLDNTSNMNNKQANTNKNTRKETNSNRNNTPKERLIPDIFPKVKTMAQELSNLIYQRYEFHHWEWFQFFLISWNISNRGWDILQYKLMKKLLYVYLHELTSEKDIWDLISEDDESFRVIFSGSSVTAGYDNHFHDSYPYIFEKRLLPLFSQLQIPLTIRNIAQYRVDCRLTNYCLSSMAGEDIQRADVISWENTFSCGKFKDVTEYVARLASFYGAVAHYATSGGYSPAQCPPSKDPIPWISERWNTSLIPADERVPDYVLNEDVVHAYRQTQHDWYEDGHAVSRFVHHFDRVYQGVAPHGFNNWGKSKALCKLPKTALVSTHEPGCEAVKVIEDLCGDAIEKFLKEEGLKHPLTITETETIRNQWKVERRPHWMVMEASFRGDGMVGLKTWHPPYAMHLLRAELMAFNYVHILLAAMMQVEKDLKSITPSVESVLDLSSKYNDYLQQLQIPIPKEPLYCAHWECNQKPRCYAHFGPLFGKDDNGRLTTKATTFTLKTLMLGEPDYQWMLKYMPYYANNEANGYIDEKFVFMVEGPNRRINFRLWNITAGVIKAYGIGGTYRIQDMEFYLDPHVNASHLDRQAKQVKYFKYVLTSKHFRLTNITYVSDTDHYHIGGIPPGDHVLAVKTPDFHKVDRFTLSHIVIF